MSFMECVQHSFFTKSSHNGILSAYNVVHLFFAINYFVSAMHVAHNITLSYYSLVDMEFTILHITICSACSLTFVTC